MKTLRVIVLVLFVSFIGLSSIAAQAAPLSDEMTELPSDYTFSVSDNLTVCYNNTLFKRNSIFEDSDIFVYSCEGKDTVTIEFYEVETGKRSTVSDIRSHYSRKTYRVNTSKETVGEHKYSAVTFTNGSSFIRYIVAPLEEGCLVCKVTSSSDPFENEDIKDFFSNTIIGGWE